MVTAALISFVVLLLAWIVAPERRAAPAAGVVQTEDEVEPEPLPLAA